MVASPTLGASSLTGSSASGAFGRRASGCRCCAVAPLVTGRTHQIRVHLATKGWPVIGDPVYGQPLWREIVDEELGAALRDFPRQALHAWRVELKHPRDGRAVRAEAPVPADPRRATRDRTARSDQARSGQRGPTSSNRSPEARAEGVRPGARTSQALLNQNLDAHAETERPWCLVSENASEIRVLRLE